MNVFEEVRKNVSISQALDYLRMGEPLERDGDQLRFKCPHCDTKPKDRSLAVNLVTGFTCYAHGQKKRGKPQER